MTDPLKLIEDAATAGAKSILIDVEAASRQGDGFRALADAAAAKALNELASQIAALRSAGEGKSNG